MGKKVTAYQAKDGSLYLEEVDQQKRDLEIIDESVLGMFDSIANELSRNSGAAKPKSSYTPERFKSLLAVLFANSTDNVEKILELIEERKQLKLEIGDDDDDSNDDSDDDDDDEEDDES